MTVLGAGLLWFGWFGFNAGSAVTAGGLAASAFTVTNIAAAAATITWVLASYLHTRKVSVVGAACGAVAGLVAITPASGYVTAGGALFIGLFAGGLCYSATLLRARSRVDDALDVFAVHGVGGMFGAIATGIFASIADPGRLLRPPRRQPAAARHPARSRSAPPSATRSSPRSSSSRSWTSCSGSGSSRRPRRWAWTSRSTARPPTVDAGSPRPTSRSPDRPPSTPLDGGRPLPLRSTSRDQATPATRRRDSPRSTTRASSTTRAGWGSSPMPAGARATGSCRWRSPGWRRSAIAARSGRTASRATAPGSRCRSIGRSSTLAGDAADAGAAGRGPGVLSLFLPRSAPRERRARALVEADVRARRPARRRLARGPVRRRRRSAPRRPPRGRRSRRRSSTPDRAAPTTRGPSRTTPSSAGWSSPGAGSRPPPARPAAASPSSSVPSASCRTIVYKGLVAGGRLPDLYPDLRAPLSRRLRGLPPALRHEHASGLAARPAVPLDRPQRRDQHGPRQPRAGPRPGRRRRHARRSRRDLLAAGPLLSPDGSDSLSLDEALELLTTTGWDLTPALLAAIPEAPGPPPRAASARRHAASSDGRVPRAVGRPGGDRLRRRPARRARWSTATGCDRRPSR